MFTSVEFNQLKLNSTREGCAVCSLDMTAEPNQWKKAVTKSIAKIHKLGLHGVTPGEITSDHGWDLPREASRLRPTIARLKAAGIRVSIFMDCTPADMQHAADIGVDRVELYTGPYAWAWGTPEQAEQTARILATGRAAAAAGLGVNAGHDLDSTNMHGLREMAELDEVSIGHAQICRALEVGTTASIGELLVSMGY